MMREEHGAFTWSEALLHELPQYMTTTVALITSGAADDYNVMAAEWTYMVAQRPPYLMVCIREGNVTGDLVAEHLEFGATFLADDQGLLADVAGHFSKADIDKCSATVFETIPSQKISPPLIRGGVAAFECGVERIIPLPGYRLFLGPALAVQTNPSKHARPLIKHGGMYKMGTPIDETSLAIAADRIVTSEDGVLCRVAGRIPHGLVGAQGVQIWIDTSDHRDGPYWVDVDDRGYFYEVLSVSPEIGAQVRAEIAGHTAMAKIG